MATTAAPEATTAPSAPPDHQAPRRCRAPTTEPRTERWAHCWEKKLIPACAAAQPTGLQLGSANNVPLRFAQGPAPSAPTPLIRRAGFVLNAEPRWRSNRVPEGLEHRICPGGAGSATKLARFVFVGAASTTLHWTTVALLVDWWGWKPLAANTVGWACALLVSFIGHRRWTFADSNVPVRKAALRFLAVACTAFVFNELAYAALLRWTGLPYQVSLVLVLVGAAIITFTLSNRWAFRR